MSDESWRQIDAKPELVWARIAWARVHLTEFVRPTNAARSLNIPSGTYRTYEVPKADGGRAPTLVTIQKIARKFKVSWSWLATGEGSPHDKGEPTPIMVMSHEIAEDLDDVPENERDAALRAVKGVIAAFKKSA